MINSVALLGLLFVIQPIFVFLRLSQPCDAGSVDGTLRVSLGLNMKSRNAAFYFFWRKPMLKMLIFYPKSWGLQHQNYDHIP